MKKLSHAIALYAWYTTCLTAIDCELADEWQPWSNCDVRCGYGVQVRLREVVRHPVNGGERCAETLQRRLCEGTHCKLPRSHHGAVSQLKGTVYVCFISLYT